jgi:hypothetical protein
MLASQIGTADPALLGVVIKGFGADPLPEARRVTCVISLCGHRRGRRARDTAPATVYVPSGRDRFGFCASD